jgi:hypothetical protein
MNLTQAIDWIENTPGLTLIVGKKKQIIITNGMTVRVTGTGIVDTVIEVQDVLKQMREAGTNV